MPRYEFEGRSAAEAAIKACEQLGITRSALRYEVVSETGEGIERRVKIALEHDGASAPRSERAAAPEREARRESARPPRRSGRGERGERSDGRRGRDRRDGRDRDRDRPARFSERSREPQEADDGFEALLQIAESGESGIKRPELMGDISARATQAQTALNGVLERMGFAAAGVIVQDDEHEIHLDVRGDDARRVIGRKGEPLLSLQFLVNRMVTHESETAPVVVLDVAGYRERRRVALAELAKKLAERATQEHKVVKLSPMSAHDRRVFHLTLKDLGGVVTRSEGDGLFRRLLIIPAEFAGV